MEHDELFHFLSIPPQQQIPQDTPLMARAPNANSCKPKSCTKKRKSSVAFGDNNVLDNESPVEHKKRIIHRDVERQRRQEMAALYQSLRSLVPDEYLQGKRSTSDHMHGTVKYVRHMKRKVDELISKRDELQELTKPGCSFSILTEFTVSLNKTSVRVQSSTTGMQIILKTTLRGGLPLSKFLSVLNGEGLSVISCVSTNANEGQLHVMESEVDQGRSFDQTKLQKRLKELLYNL